MSSGYAKTPTVSVVLSIAKDHRAALEAALPGVLAQTFQALEIIVVNDGGASLDAQLDRLGAGEKIVSLRLPHSRGKARARNAGLAVARGQYIAWLDEQDRWLPGHLEALIAALDGGKHEVAYADARKQSEKLAGKLALTVHEFFSSGEPDPDRWIQGATIPLSCMLYERACVGPGFDETLGALDDWELLLRLSAKSFVHLPRASCVLGGPFISELEPVRRASANIIRNRHRHAPKAALKSPAPQGSYEALFPALEDHLARNEDAKAIALLEDFVAAQPDCAEALNDLAAVLQSAGRSQDALPHALRAAFLEPRSAVIISTLAVIQIANGGLESAARTILPLLNLHPDDPNLLAVANEIGRRAEEDSKRSEQRSA